MIAGGQQEALRRGHVLATENQLAEFQSDSRVVGRRGYQSYITYVVSHAQSKLTLWYSIQVDIGPNKEGRGEGKRAEGEQS